MEELNLEKIKECNHIIANNLKGKYNWTKCNDCGIGLYYSSEFGIYSSHFIYSDYSIYTPYGRIYVECNAINKVRYNSFDITETNLVEVIKKTIKIVDNLVFL